jgi:hypothetical protein
LFVLPWITLPPDRPALLRLLGHLRRRWRVWRSVVRLRDPPGWTPPRSTRVRVGGGSDCDGLRLIMRRRRS